MQGDCYIVAEGATGAWSGKSQCLAAWSSGGWRFISPVEGVALLERSSGTCATFRNGAWEFGILRGASVLIGGDQVVGARGAAIESPTGGAFVDAEARAALNAILDTMRQHGLIAS